MSPSRTMPTSSACVDEVIAQFAQCEMAPRVFYVEQQGVACLIACRKAKHAQSDCGYPSAERCV